MDLDELEQLAWGRGLSISDLTRAVRSLPTMPRDGPDDAALLRLRGLGIAASEPSDVPLLVGALRRILMEKEALSVGEVGTVLQEDPTDVAARLTGPDRDLMAFRGHDGQWCIPAFQLEHGLHQLQAWARLLQALPPPDETSPAAVVDWLTLAKPHLGGLSRVQALRSGDDVDQLVAEAATFAMPA